LYLLCNIINIRIFQITNVLLIPPYSDILSHYLHEIEQRIVTESVQHEQLCMYKGWAIKLALAPRPLMIYCASPLADAMIITVAALRIVLEHGSKPT
jgi:hypothetical protein